MHQIPIGALQHREALNDIAVLGPLNKQLLLKQASAVKLALTYSSTSNYLWFVQDMPRLHFPPEPQDSSKEDGNPSRSSSKFEFVLMGAKGGLDSAGISQIRAHTTRELHKSRRKRTQVSDHWVSLV